jgi:hypothetical protein
VRDRVVGADRRERLGDLLGRGPLGIHAEQRNDRRGEQQDRRFRMRNETPTCWGLARSTRRWPPVSGV